MKLISSAVEINEIRFVKKCNFGLENTLFDHFASEWKLRNSTILRRCNFKSGILVIRVKSILPYASTKNDVLPSKPSMHRSFHPIDILSGSLDSKDQI